METKQLYKPFKSNRTPYKYSVYVKGENGNPKLIHFGHREYSHYFDQIGEYKHLNHNDKERRKSYLARAKGIRDKDGNLTWKDKNTANWWSVHKLWM